MYDSLTTNIPHPVMAYTSFAFPPSTPLFPPASTVQTYLESYATHFKLTQHIRFKTNVLDVRRQSGSHKWKVQTSAGDLLDFDLVIVANGRHRVPRYPDIPGLSRWISIGKACHSAWYRHPRSLGPVVLVVGGGPSGKDIFAEICTTGRTAIHSVTGGVREDTGTLKEQGRVVEFKNEDQVVFEDGTMECGVDHCVVATGYEISFPFLTKHIIQSGIPPVCPPLPQDIFSSGQHVFPLAKHIFPLQSAYPPSTIAFMGLMRKGALFPVLEAQSRAVIKVFEDPATLDSIKEVTDIAARHAELRSRFGDDAVSIGKHWHKYEGQESFDYQDRLYEFAEDDDSARVVVADWMKEMYLKRAVLRTAWRELERTGEASDWVKGVGEGGTGEWVSLMKRLLTRAEGSETL